VLAGSLRTASFNRMLAIALMSLAPSSVKLDIVEVGQLPFKMRILRPQLHCPRNGPRSGSASRPLMQFCSSRLNMTGRCLPSLRMHWMSVPGRMEAASGTASPVRSSAARGRDRGFRRQSSPEAVARVSKRADHAAARSLCRP
jgi:hypothetical protein